MSTSRLLILLSLFVALTLVLSGALPSAAQPDQPPATPPLEKHPPEPNDLADTMTGGPVQTADGLWMMRAGDHDPLEPAALTPEDTGGPDDFGYTGVQ